MVPNEGGTTAGEVQAQGQAPATEAATSAQGATPAADPQPWKVKIGDTEYDEASWRQKGPEDFRRFHGEFTRSRQELSQLRAQSEPAIELLNFIRSDPQLLAEVRARIQAGQTPQQAVNGAVANDPRLDKVDTMATRLETIEQERATEAFNSKYKDDLTEEAKDWIVNWISERSDKLRNAGWDYSEILETAYSHYYREVKAPQLLTQGQRMKEEEIKKGRDAKALGTVSPTAQAAPKKRGPTIHMKPSERLDAAMEAYRRNAKKG